MKNYLVVLVMVLAVCSIPSARASNFSVGDIPSGDTKKLGSNVSVLTSNATVLSESSNGGILNGFHITHSGLANASGNQIDTLILSVDGGTETRYTSLGWGYLYNSTGNSSLGYYVFIPHPIRFNSSVIVKMRKNNTNSTIQAQADYNLRPGT
jgi:hypothetical protein